jgi:ABC-type taurine transport system ATPase subunit
VAVYDVDLQIEDREFVVLVRPSGCGKSTTLRKVAGFEDVPMAKSTSERGWSTIWPPKAGTFLRSVLGLNSTC